MKTGKNKRNTAGFTIIEIIVVIVIIGILLSFSITGLFYWQKFSMYKKNNEYAETLFVSAQSALAHYKATGRLKELENSIKKDQALKNQRVDDSIMNSLPFESSHEFYYLDIAPSDVPDENNLLYNLLKPYVYEKEIFNAAIRMEFDPVDGTVYSVSYTDRAKGFDYSDADGKDTVGIMGLSRVNREESRRRDLLLGYYDTDMSEIAPSGYLKPSISRVDLINEEILYLQISLASKSRMYLRQYAYSVELTDTKGKRRISFVVNDGGDFNSLTLKPTQYRVKATVYDNEGINPREKEMAMDMYCTEKNQLCIVLDAADLDAAEKLDAAVKEAVPNEDVLTADTYEDTYSILRFGLKPNEKIRAKVIVSDKYKDSNSKSSAYNHPFMGEKSIDENYQILNSRHLFNIRFVEQCDQAGTGNSYIQKNNVIWGGENGIIANGKLYNAQKSILQEDAYAALFPPIPELKEGSSYSAETGLNGLFGNYSIAGLTIRQEVKTEKLKAEEIVDPVNYATGLFRVNRGTLTKTTFTDAVVQGVDYVGTACGVNYGILSEIKVEKGPNQANVTGGMKRDYVEGRSFVGGIAGSDQVRLEGGAAVFAAGSYNGLENAADISGRSFVGGIIGYSSLGKDETVSGENLQIIQCTNTGKVAAKKDPEEADFEKYQYIGGIVGFKDGGAIASCTSKNGDEDFLQLDTEREFIGDFVGGIVGYCQNAKISGCNTEGGIIIGRQYVGGIVGFHGIKTGNATAGETLSLNGQKGGKPYGNNRAIVIGEMYIGGIAGACAAEDQNAHLSEAPQEGLIIENWMNSGVVLAYKGYSGGIAGYNTGIIKNCGSDANAIKIEGAELLEFAQKWLIMPKDYKENEVYGYAGGLVGYNNGKIESENIQRINSVAVGVDFVGGMIGYNAENGELDINKYILAGGYVSGQNHVGGMIGLNASESLFAFSKEESFNKVLTAAPNLVRGRYCVGGIIGSNIIAPANDLWMQGVTDNFFGNVTAVLTDAEGNSVSGGFVGGYIGYNRLVDEKEKIPEAVKVMDDVFRKNTDSLEAAKQLITERTSGTAGEKMLTIWDNTAGKKNDGKGKRTNNLQEVSGGICVGGIVGYSAAGSRLTILQVCNKAKVKGSASVESMDRTSLKEDDPTEPANFYEDETKEIANQSITQYKGKDGEKVRYSYTGGIIGMVEEGVTIDNCVTTAEITTDTSTYYGSIAEVNRGIIQNCDTTSLGNGERSYVGGIVGRNEGAVYNCEVNETIIGVKAVGGVAAENYGIISSGRPEDGEVFVNGTISCKETLAGGVAAFNAGIISNYKISASQEVTANYVGGITGINVGEVQNVSMDATKKLAIRGKKFVGGFIGWMRNAGKNQGSAEAEINVKQLTKLINTANVTAIDGYAGGIVGYMDKQDGDNQIQISNCISTGSVKAEKNNDAGGITSCNAGMIVNCQVNGTVEAGDGISGGIAAVNEEAALIDNCQVSPLEKEERIVFKGTFAVGGIAGKNLGEIKNSSILNSEVRNQQAGGDASSIGGIAGENGEKGENKAAAIIQSCRVGGEDDNQKIEVISVLSDCYAGGIAGRNYGSILGESGEKSTQIYANVKVDSESKNGWLGGVVGYNEVNAELRNIAEQGSISGNNGASYGYGGIAGGNNGTIQFCAFSGSVQAKGAGNDLVSAGGIAGKNNRNGQIQNCNIAYSEDSIVELTAGYAGGISGTNEGNVSNINTKSGYKVNIQIGFGHAGGMVGVQRTSGTIGNCENSGNWSVEAKNHQSDNAVGGMIGYNYSGNPIQELKNHANVTKTVGGSDSVGGIIGRQENTVSEGFVMNKCTNDGKITGRDRVGGIIGQWKYLGGSLYECSNNGIITTNSRTDQGMTGGIVGTIFGLSSDTTVSIDGCRNDGKVIAEKTDNSSGGIIGRITQNYNNANIYIANCLNTGDISVSTNNSSAGIVGNMNESNQISVHISNCRNYGLASGTGGMLSGIFGKRDKGNIFIQKCFGVTDLNYPISNIITKTNSENYYFTEKEYKQSGVFFSNVYSSDHDKEEGDILSITDQEKNTRYAFKPNGGKVGEGKITLELSEPVSLSEIQVDWYGANRTYNYDIYVKTEPDGEYKLFLKNQAGSGNGVLNDRSDAGDAEWISVSEEIQGQLVYGVAFYINGNTENNPYISVWGINLKYTEKDSGAVKFVEQQKLTDGEKGDGIPLNVKEESGEYKAYFAKNHASGAIIPHLDVNPVTYNGGRNELCNRIDNQLKVYYYVAEKLGPLSGLELSITDKGKFMLKWDPVTKTISGKPTVAAGYAININVYDKEEDTEPAGSSTMNIYSGVQAVFAAESSWAEKYMQVEVTALSGYETQFNSEPAKSEKVKVQKALPVPDIHLELDGNSSDEKIYSIYLDNFDEYREFLNADCKIVITINNSKLNKMDYPLKDFKEETVISKDVDNSEISSKTVGVYRSVAGVAEDNRLLSVYADAGKSGFLSSQTRTWQTALFTKKNYRNQKTADRKIESSGSPQFTGTTVDTLGYSVTIGKGGGNNAIYNRSEILLYDSEIGEKVVCAEAENFISSQTAEKVEVNLTNLPEDLIAETIVKDYDVTVRSYAWAMQEHKVYLGNAYYKKANASANEIKDLSGIWNGEGDKRTLKPGYIIVRHTDEENQDEVLYDVKYSTILAFDGENDYGSQKEEKTFKLPERQNVPIIEPEPQIKDGKYIFIWDKEGNEKDAIYNYVLTGITKDGKKVEITSAQEQTVKSFEVDPSNWSYIQLILKVTRVGTLKKEFTEKLGADAKQEYKMYLKLDRREAPEIELHEGNRDELEYDISWLPLKDEEQKKDLQSYEVLAEIPAGEEGKEFEVVKLGKVTAEEAEEMKGGRLKLTADLRKYQGKTLYIYVNCIALPRQDEEGKPNEDVNYTDSDKGVARERVIPKRLQTPEPESATMYAADELTEITGDEVWSKRDFTQNGFVLRVMAETEAIGTYKMEAGIYGSEAVNDSGEVKLKEADDGAKEEVIDGNRLWPQENSLLTNMDGTLSQGSYKLKGLSDDLAGKYLIVRFRAASPSNISSLWSGYKVFKLPKVWLMTPELSQMSEKDTIVLNEGMTAKSINYDAMSWEEDTHSTGYKAWIDTLDYGSKKTDVLTVKKQMVLEEGKEIVNGFEVLWNEQSLQLLKEENDSLITYTANLDSFDYLAEGENANEQFKVKLSGRLRIEVEHNGEKQKISYSLILPDAEIEDIGRYLYTGSIILQSVGDEENENLCYADSVYSQWMRIRHKELDMELTFLERELQSLEQKSEAPSNQDYIIFEVKNGLPYIVAADKSDSGKKKKEAGSARRENASNGIDGNDISGNDPDDETTTETESETESEMESETGESSSEQGSLETETETGSTVEDNELSEESENSIQQESTQAQEETDDTSAGKKEQHTEESISVLEETESVRESIL